MDTGEELPVVVDCVLQMDTVQTLRLYHMKRLSGEGYEPVAEAKVELQMIQKNGNFFKVADFHRSEGILWETRFEPAFGESYRLSITLPGKEEISATTTFPEDLRLVLRRKAMKDGTGRYDSTRDTTYLEMISAEVATASMVTEDDFLRGVMKGVPFPDTAAFPVKAYLPTGNKACKMWIYPRRDSIVVYPPNNRPEHNPPFTFSDLPFIPSRKPYCNLVVTDHPYADNFNLVSGKVTDLDIVNVPVNSVERVKKIYMEYDGFYHLVLISSSLLNYTQWIPKMCSDLPLHKGFVRIDQPEGFSNGLTDEDFKTSYLSTSGSFLILGDYSDYLTGVEPFLIEVRFLSDEYDAFLRDLHVRNLSRDNFVLSTYDSNNIYSNISGGVGVFGAENTTWAEEACKKSFPYSLIIF
jgi:hypothetical protein